MGSVLAAWAGAGLALGLALTAGLAAVNPSVRGASAIAAGVVLSVVYGLLLAVAGGIVASLRRLAGRRKASFGGELLVAASAVVAAAITDALVPELGHRWVGRFVAALPVAIGLAVALVLPRPHGGGARVAAALLLLVLGAQAVGIALLVGPAAPAGPAPAPPAVGERPRVLWVGIDGADWRHIDRLVAGGQLPHLAGLMERGVRAPLATFEPTWSPLIWTTLATGVHPRRHGVLDFAESRLPGAGCGVQRLRKAPRLLPDLLYLGDLTREAWRSHLLREIPVTSCQRRRKAAWNILSERGCRVAVVNWFATWPAEPVDGVLISDNNPWRAAFLAAKHRPDDARVAHAVTWPRGYLERLDALAVPELPDDAEDLAHLPYFADVPQADLEALLAKEPAMLLVFRHILSSDAFASAAAARLLRTERPDFTAVYLSAVDNTSHRLGPLPGVVDRVWRTTDAQLGRLLQAAGPDATVVVTSDHGWEYGEPFGHFHAPPGILLLAGPGIASPGRLDARPDVYDVAPTILALFGLPAAEEMPGAPLLDALAPSVRAVAELPRPATYGAFAPPAPEVTARGSALQDETLERLRALGYVE